MGPSDRNPLKSCVRNVQRSGVTIFYILSERGLSLVISGPRSLMNPFFVIVTLTCALQADVFMPCTVCSTPH